ncbi:MAG: SGNH hydrolase domain-containing protein [Acidimicrobiales bacterium]
MVNKGLIAGIFTGLSLITCQALSQPVASAQNSHAISVIPSAQKLSKLVQAAAKVEALPNLVVPLSKLISDFPIGTNAPDARCLYPASNSNFGPRPACDFGDLSSDRTLVLFGDSNALMWLPAFITLGDKYSFRVKVLSLASCNFADVPMWNGGSDVPGVACTKFHQWAMQQIKSIHPFATVLVNLGAIPEFTYQHTLIPDAVFASAIVETIKTVVSESGSTIVLGTPPYPLTYVDPASCLAIHSSNIRVCSTLPDQAGQYQQTLPTMKSSVAKAGAKFINVVPWFCTMTVCPIVINDTAVYYDQYHITSHFAEELSTVLGNALVSYGAKLTG